MALTSGLPEDEPMNLTPMIDVVFNLLIFFLLGSTIINEASEEREVELQLPTVQAAAPLTEAPQEITVNVTAEGRIVIGSATLTLEQLADRLKTARQNYPEQVIAVRGDRDVRYQKVAEVVALCRRVGIAHLDILVQEQ